MEKQSITSVSKLYNNCANRKKDTYNYDKLKLRMNELFGDSGWPLIASGWKESENFDLNSKMKIIIKLNRLAIKGRILNFITRSVHPRSSMLKVKNVIGISGAFGDLIYKTDRDEKVVEYVTLMRGMIKEVYGKELEAKDVKAIMDFERQISKIFLEDSASLKSESVSGMNSKYPSVDWENILKDLGIDLSKISLVGDNDQVFLLNNPIAFNNSLTLIDGTHERLFKNYLGWRYFLFLAPFTSLTLRSLVFRFENLTFQVEEQVDISEKCLVYVGSFMPFAVGKLFLDHYFRHDSEESKEKLIHEINNTINGLKDSFYSMIDSNDWIDFSTKKNAFEKLNNMKVELFFPSFLADDKKLDDFYSGLNFKDDDFMSNIIEMYHWLSDKSFNEFRVPQEVHSWDQRSPIEVNAFYSISFNTINVPIGAIAGPFYDPNQPSVVNYGSLGFVLGHEITHGFDSLGRRYDSAGQENDWWTEESKNAFLNRSNCFVDQYETFKLDEFSLRGTQVLDETIADAGGLAEAFKVRRSLSD